MALRRWKTQHIGLTAAGMSALTLAVGCGAPVAQPLAAAPVAQDSAAKATFKAINKNGQLTCDSCGAKLNAKGHHTIGETLVRAVQYMKTPESFAQKPTTSKLDLKALVVASIGKIGYTKLGITLPADAAAAGADRVNQFPDPCPDDECWRQYINNNPGGCCIPDGVPIPDPPY